MVKNQKKPKEIKKYKSAYIFFTQEKIPKYKKLYPNKLFRELFKLIGEEWKNLNENLKLKYYDLEKKSKELFENNKQKVKYNYTINQKKNKKPIRTRTPFMIYLHENKKNIDKKNCISSLKKIGEIWKNLSEKEKGIYIRKAEDDKERYKKDLFEYFKNKDKNRKNKIIKDDEKNGY